MKRSEKSRLDAVVGINWGDEGKGRMVDLLAADYDIIARYQGGNNAGHTVINDKGKFILNLLPSGILGDGKVNVMGGGMVIDIEHLSGEIKKLTDAGIVINSDNLKISDKAVICMPYHKRLDELEEDRLAGKKFGSTRRGIAPVYGDKYMKKVLRMGDLFSSDAVLLEKLEGYAEWKNLMIVKGYGSEPVKAAEMLAWVRKYGDGLKPHVCDMTKYLTERIEDGAKVLFEAQLGALRDVDFGIFPYTTSSNAIAAYAPIGAGIPYAGLDGVIGIMKAYSSCVGEGPFTCEFFGAEADALREAGGEYGAATGRPRRVGAFDAVASRYGCLMQGATEVALTKLDILSYMDKLPICTGYEVDGEITGDFPTGERLDKAKPVVEYMPGFKCDVSACRRKEELPKEALDYIARLEKEIQVPITYVSVGADRNAIIDMRK